MKPMHRTITTIIAVIMAHIACHSEEFTMRYSVEADAYCGSGEYTPFYMMNNTSGAVSYKPNSGYLRAGIFKDAAKDKKFTYTFGLELIGGYRNDADIYLQQAYIEARLKAWSIFGGAREEYSMLWDKELSGGSMIWSGNSRPIPQIYIGLPQFTEVPFAKGLFRARGGISYGWFVDYPYQKEMRSPDTRYTQGLLYHRKNLVLEIGRADRSFYGVIGIDMAAQFGGTVKNVQQADGTYSDVKFNSGIKEYFKVLVPLSGGDDSPQIDQVNVTGNHVGIYILSLGYRKSGWDIKAYYEHYFDDHSGMIFKNKCDGLWGISVTTDKTFPVEGLTFEIMNTTNQSGPFLYDATQAIPIQVSAGDHYYGHVLYNGWTHRGHTMGTPFITSPVYNGDGFLGFTNNISRAYHGGIRGTIIPGLKYRALASYQKGWGTPYAPSTDIMHEFSAMLELKYTPQQLAGWDFTLSGAIDAGTLYGDNWGVRIGVRKTGTLIPWPLKNNKK